MDKLERIQQPIKKELSLLNNGLREALRTNSPLMNSVVDYYLGTKGKQIRPVLVLLAARLFGKINQKTLDAAISIELLHNASLIHDDVVDDSRERRGRGTINGMWDNRIAVLVGDYFVSCALKQSISTGNIELIDTLATLGKELAHGEIDQLSNAREHSLNEEAYLNVIRQKTASLFVSCMRVGAVSVGASEVEKEKLMRFGEYLGLCFQIKDDIFDYIAGAEIGKPTGNDLREGKVTLPLIFAANKNNDNGMRVCALLRQDHLSVENIEELIAVAVSEGGIDYARQAMTNYQEKAFEILDSFPPSLVIDSLREVFMYTIDREK